MASNSKAPAADSTVVEDANIVAFLVMKGFIAIPFIQTPKTKGGNSSRVAWDVQGYNVDAAVKRFYGNESVGIRDYVKSLKEIRASMYNIKQINDQLKKAD